MSINFPAVTLPNDRSSGMVSQNIGEVSIFCSNTEVFECTPNIVTAKVPLDFDGGVSITGQILGDSTQGVGAPSFSFSTQPNAGVYLDAGRVAISHNGTLSAAFSNTDIDAYKPITVAYQGSGVSQITINRSDGSACLSLRNESYNGLTAGGSINDVALFNQSGAGNIYLRAASSVGILPFTNAANSASTTRFYCKDAGNLFATRFLVNSQPTYGQVSITPGAAATPSYSFIGAETTGLSYIAGNLTFVHSGASVADIDANAMNMSVLLRQASLTVSAAAYDMTNSSRYNNYQYTGTVVSTWTMAFAVNSVGAPIQIHNTGTQNITLNRRGADTFGIAAAVSITIATSQSIIFYSRGNTQWYYTIMS